MKSILLPCAILLSILVNAQIRKGTVLLGGTISSNTYKVESSNSTITSKQSNILISPSIGVATKENVIWGMNAYYGTDKNNNSQQPEYTTYTSYGAGIFTRRYVPLGKEFYVFGQAGLDYNHSEQNYPYYASQVENHTNSWGISLNASPGIAYGISKRIQLELGLPNMLHIGYSKGENVYISPTTQSSSTTKGVSVGMNLNPSTALAVGFRILLAK